MKKYRLLSILSLYSETFRIIIQEDLINNLGITRKTFMRKMKANGNSPLSFSTDEILKIITILKKYGHDLTTDQLIIKPEEYAPVHSK